MVVSIENNASRIKESLARGLNLPLNFRHPGI